MRNPPPPPKFTANAALSSDAEHSRDRVLVVKGVRGGGGGGVILRKTHIVKKKLFPTQF